MFPSTNKIIEIKLTLFPVLPAINDTEIKLDDIPVLLYCLEKYYYENRIYLQRKFMR